MKYLMLIFTILLMAACSKTNTTGMKMGQALFYSDAFVAANCKIDSVSIFIDNKYKGKLTHSFLPLSQAPDIGDANTFVSELSAGDHVYVARISGCPAGLWSGTFFVPGSSCEKIDLELLTLKPALKCKGCIYTQKTEMSIPVKKPGRDASVHL